jgi:hypothetical protein
MARSPRATLRIAVTTAEGSLLLVTKPLAPALKAAFAGHRDVQQDDIRVVRLEGAVGVGRVVGFRHDMEIALALQHAAVALPHDRMIVDQQHGDACCRNIAHVGLMRRAGWWRRR